MLSCDELGVPAALEISRSGQGAHAWVFFSGRVSARDARRLGTAIISHTCARTRQLKLASYDRLFPNQDTMPKGGFGNLIALPLQKHPRESGCSVFVDSALRPHPDQWAFLAGVQPMAPHDIEPPVLRATGGVHPLDVTFIDDEDLATPWKRQATTTGKLAGTMPRSLTVTLANMVYQDEVSCALGALVGGIEDLPSHVGTVRFFSFLTSSLCTLPATLGMGAMFPLTLRLFSVSGTNAPALLSIPDYEMSGWFATDQASMAELDAGTGELTTMRKGAADGSCGSEGTYRWDGKRFALQEMHWQACGEPDAKGPPFPIVWPTQQGAVVDPNGATPAP